MAVAAREKRKSGRNWGKMKEGEEKEERREGKVGVAKKVVAVDLGPGDVVLSCTVLYWHDSICWGGT